MNSPAEVAANYVAIGKKKAELPIVKMLLMGILAGAFIALGAAGANTAAHGAQASNMVRLLACLFFPAGLAMVLLAGSELFTGNCLLIIPLMEKQIGIGGLLKNWVFVYIGNLLGSLLIAFLVVNAGQLNIGAGALGAFTIKVAASKAGLDFTTAFCSGILCNTLVCLAVWVSFAAKDVPGKILGLYLPIALFVLCGFEHSVANMFFIPAGLLALANPTYAALAAEGGVNTAGLTWNAFFINNLVPVTLGNIVGGMIFVGLVYWYIFLYKAKKA